MKSIVCKMESSNSLIDHEEKVEKWTNELLLNDRHHLTRIASWIWQLAKNAILYDVFFFIEFKRTQAAWKKDYFVLSVCHKRTALFSNEGNYYPDGDLLPDPITTNLINYGLSGRVKRHEKLFRSVSRHHRETFFVPLAKYWNQLTNEARELPSISS